MNKQRIYMTLLLIMTMATSACNISEVNNQVKHYEYSTANTVEKNENETLNNVDPIMKSFIIKYITGIEQEDAKAFKELVDEYGIYSITIFIDGRDPNKVLHLYRDQIRDDLVLANSEKVGITLGPLFSDDVSDVMKNLKMHPVDISYNVDWHNKDEAIIQEQLEDIIKTCEKIILTNNEFVPQIFELKDNFYVFTLSDAIHDPDVEIIGDWIIFEKTADQYKLRAVMQFY